MAATSLSCKECGDRLRARGPLRLRACFGPLEVAYDLSGSTPPRRRRKIQAGPQRHLALRGLPPLRGAPARSARAGADAAGARRPARRAARPRRGLDQERRRQPDPLASRTGWSRSRRQGEGARLRDGRLRLDRQPRQRGRRPRRRRRPRVLRLRPGRPRGAEAARDRHLRHQPGRRQRQLRRRQPALHRARRDAALGVRQRQPAPLLRRGLEDARLRDHRAARLGAARPDRLPDRLRVAVHQDRPRDSRSGSSSAWSRASCRPSAAPRPTGCCAGRRRRSPTARRLQAAAARHDRQEPRDRQPGRRPLRARAGAPHRRRRSSRSPTTRSAPGSGCSPRRPGSSPRPPAASRSACSRSSPSAGAIGSDERVVAYITGEGLKTLDAVRETSACTRSSRRSTPFEREFEGEPARELRLARGR